MSPLLLLCLDSKYKRSLFICFYFNYSTWDIITAMCLSYDYLHITPDIITAPSLRPTYQTDATSSWYQFALALRRRAVAPTRHLLFAPRVAPRSARDISPPVGVMFAPPPPPLDLACGTRPSKTLPLSRLLFLVSVNRLGVSRSFGSLSWRHVCPVQSRWVCSWTCLDLLFLIRFFVPDLYAEFS